MQYVILMTSPEGVWEALPEARQAEIVVEHDRATEELRASGKYVCSFRMGEPEQAHTVRRDARDAIRVEAGPLDPKGEVIGGLYVIDVESEEEALAWGRRLRFIEGSNEVRPVWS